MCIGGSFDFPQKHLLVQYDYTCVPGMSLVPMSTGTYVRTYVSGSYSTLQVGRKGCTPSHHRKGGERLYAVIY